MIGKGETQKSGSSASRPREWHVVPCCLLAPWDPEALTEAQAPWCILACLALGASEFRLRIRLQTQCVLSLTLLQGRRKRSSKRNSRNYCRFGFPMQAQCLDLPWETRVHSEWLVPGARDLRVGFVSTSAPLSTYSVLELPQHAAFHKSLFFKPSPTVSAPERQSD